MIEVEAKIAISNPQKIRKIARNLGKFKEKIKKTDDYYTMEDLKSYPQKSLRIRKSNGGYVINFKNKISKAHGIHAKKETEFNVRDIKNFIDLIEDFGFRKWLAKEKESEIFEINKDFHIEINRVKNLGWFLEIEYLVKKEKEIDNARNKINKVIDELGLSKEKVIEKGYTRMLWRRLQKSKTSPIRS